MLLSVVTLLLQGPIVLLVVLLDQLLEEALPEEMVRMLLVRDLWVE
jgi:hypothetical protein